MDTTHGTHGAFPFMHSAAVRVVHPHALASRSAVTARRCRPSPARSNRHVPAMARVRAQCRTNAVTRRGGVEAHPHCRDPHTGDGEVRVGGGFERGRVQTDLKRLPGAAHAMDRNAYSPTCATTAANGHAQYSSRRVPSHRTSSPRRRAQTRSRRRRGGTTSTSLSPAPGHIDA